MNKIIYNKYIPFKGFMMINLFGLLFAREEYKNSINKYDINHEMIHTAQMKELLYIPFYIRYLLEYLFNLLIYWDKNKAYRNICFEKEAYNNQYDLAYLKTRKPYEEFNKK